MSWCVEEGAASLARRVRENVTKKVALEWTFMLGFEASLGGRKDRHCLTVGGYFLPELLFVLILASSRRC